MNIFKRGWFFFSVSLATLATIHAQEPPAPLPGASPTVAPASFSEAQFKNLKVRWIGPATMGGRVSDIAIDPRNPAVFYIGLAHGGVFKTSDNGVTFDPIFDKESALSIGAVAIAPSDSSVVWVGSGEGNDRNSSGWGDGVYRSTDGGGSWQNVGLKNSRAIGRIIVHPTNPEIAYVAASGNLWADGGERGLFKTTDGGKNWKLILQAAAPNDARTGCSDVAFDPSNPEIVYAALYARQRQPWGFSYGPALTGGADVGGIFKSTNGGATWKKLSDGLPTATGRIGLATTPANPHVVMAIVQSANGGAPSELSDIHSKTGGVFRSENGGEKWTRMSDVDPRPFYFSQIRIDPANDQRVYVLEFALLASDDGGKTFREDLSEKLHPDCHALAIQNGSALAPKPPQPNDKNKQPPAPPISQRLLVGNDGGVYQSYAGGKSWDHLNKIPSGEYYRISLDDSQPIYRIAGGLQDNSIWIGPSRTLTKEGIRNSDWLAFTGADGFYVLFDPTDPDVFYGDNQGGSVVRFNQRTGELRSLRPEAQEGQPRFRFHWNAPLILSAHHAGTLYLGGNHVLRLTDHAEHYEVISPDLSKDEPAKTNAQGSGAENYGVVFALAESPLRAGMLWAGTDDGRLWLTENDGGKWTELTANLPEPFRGEWIARIEPGAKDAQVAYVVLSGYHAGDDRPAILRTADAGKTWQSVIGQGLPPNDPVQVAREDPVNPNLLYAGTQFGLFFSLDQGANWMRLGGVPAVRVDDLKIHPRTHDLVVATHGRSLAILDDTRALRDLTPALAAEPAHLFPIAPVAAAYELSGFADWNGKGVFRGQNPPEGALLTMWVKELTGDEVKITITNSAGTPVASLKAPGIPGLTRVSWNLFPTEEFLTKYGGDDPKSFVPSGDYTAELSYGKTKMKQTFHLEVAPGITPRVLEKNEAE